MKIDTSHLISLLGNEETAQRFVALFLEKLPEQLDILHQSFAAGDWETVSITAHSLKSQFRYLGLQTEADLLQKVEDDPQHEAAEKWITGAVEGFK